MKYQALSPEAKKQAEVFLDFLWSTQKVKKPFNMADWKQRIKTIPQWSEEDVDALEENSKLFNKWASPGW